MFGTKMIGIVFCFKCMKHVKILKIIFTEDVFTGKIERQDFETSCHHSLKERTGQDTFVMKEKEKA